MSSESCGYVYYYKQIPISRTYIIKKPTVSGPKVPINDGNIVTSFLDYGDDYPNSFLWEYNLCNPFWINKYYFSICNNNNITLNKYMLSIYIFILLLLYLGLKTIVPNIQILVKNNLKNS